MKVKITKTSWMEEQHKIDVKPIYCCSEAEEHLHTSDDGKYVYMEEADSDSCGYSSPREVRVRWCPFCGTKVSIE